MKPKVRKIKRAKMARKWLRVIKLLKRQQKRLREIADQILVVGLGWNNTDLTSERMMAALDVLDMIVHDFPCPNLMLLSYLIQTRGDAGASALAKSIADDEYPRHIKAAREARSCYL